MYGITIRVILRHYLGQIDALLKPGKVFVLDGPRQVGKTTLVPSSSFEVIHPENYLAFVR